MTALNPPLRNPLYFPRYDPLSGGGADADADADVVTENPTEGQVVELDLDSENKNRHTALFDGLVLSASDSIVLEFRRKLDSVWEQGATSYQYKELQASTKTNPTLAANLPVGDYSAVRGPIDGVFMVTGSGLAVPTQVVSRDWDNSGEIHDCTMTNEDIHDRVRFRIVGAATYVSGTIYLIRME